MIWALEAAGLVLAALAVLLLGGRSRLVQIAGALVFVALGAALASHLLLLEHPAPARLAEGLGALSPTRIMAGIILGAVAMLALEISSAGEGGPSAAAEALFLILSVAAAAALCTNSLVVAAGLVGLLMGAVWVRWQRVAGPQLSVRSVARQAVVATGCLLGAAAVVPSVRVGGAPPLLEAILLTGAVTAVLGVFPFSGWPGVIGRLGHSELAFWRLLLLPTGALLEARLVAMTTSAVASPMRELLIGLGLATALFWGMRALLGPDQGRYPRTLACDGGLICAGIGFGTLEGLSAAMVLLVCHWLGGAVLGPDETSRPRLVGWIGMSGVPPFGGFTGRLLVVLAATAFSPVVSGILLLASGLQLGASAAAMRSSLSPRTAGALRWSQVVAVALAAGTLVLGVVPVTAVHLLMGFRP